MLNREKVAKDISAIVAKLFPDHQKEFALAKQKWQEIIADDSFAYRSQAAQSSFLVPRWDGSLNDVVTIDPKAGDHTVIAVDGSQIYPDRHISGAGCFLINVGGVTLSYLGVNAPGKASSVEFFSEPHVLLPEDVSFGQAAFSRDLVDLKREEYELGVLADRSGEICFVDGTIIFWQLESKPPEVKSYFLQKYLGSLEKLYQNKTLVAGYISMPKSRELVSLLKLGLCRFSIADCIPCHSNHESFPCKAVDAVLDTQVTRFFLKPNQRTTVFYSTSKIVDCYPEHLKPAFVYLHVGSEIVRLEVPTWIAKEQQLLDRLCAVAIDQSVKGRGYPVCLAEAHEQAVVKGGDRDFFYHILHKIGIEYNKRMCLSQKAIKKRGIGI